MKFLLQADICKSNIIEIFNLKRILYDKPLLYSYIEINYKDMIRLISEERKYKDYIPVGDLKFVFSFLNYYYNIDNLNPIEVPDILRKDRYLKRRYEFIKKKDIKYNQMAFIKDISTLKKFNYPGYIDKELNIPGNDDTLFLYSEFINIKSEYRIIVLDDEIQGIQFYNGDCTVFPNVKILREMINLYSLTKGHARAYTLDIAITDKLDTVILEIHPFVSVGTYGYSNSNLPCLYRLGIDYYINNNYKILK